MNVHDWVIVGRFGRPHGVKGLITIISFTEPRENILHYEPWYAEINNRWQPVKLERVEVHSKYLLAQIENYIEREQAASLTNTEIAIKRSQLPQLETGEYYWHQLLGMKVVNQQGIELGFITDMMPTGANDVMVVVGEKRYLIPYIPDKFILNINEKERLIVVEWDANF